jgi:co-chaperonin GroES (HSP10)
LNGDAPYAQAAQSEFDLRRHIAASGKRGGFCFFNRSTSMSNTSVAKKTNDISESKLDPKAAHLHFLGKYEDEVLHSQVVVMTYVSPTRTAGGIIRPDQTKDEDRFQGKIGLVVAVGPGAFKDDGIAKFHGKKIKVGDWVYTRYSDGLEFFYNGCSLRIFEDVSIKAIVSDPTRYW